MKTTERIKKAKKSKQASETRSDFLTVADVAAKLSTSTKSILRRIENERLKAKWDGGKYLVAAADYYAYVESLPNKRP